MSLAARVKHLKETHRSSRERPVQREGWPAVVARLRQAGVEVNANLHWWEVIDYLSETLAQQKTPGTGPGVEEHGEQRDECTTRARV